MLGSVLIVPDFIEVVMLFNTLTPPLQFVGKKIDIEFVF